MPCVLLSILDRYLLGFFLFPSESSTPTKQTMANTIKVVWMALMILSIPASLMRASPMVKYMMIVMVAIPESCPIIRIVLIIELAMP